METKIDLKDPMNHVSAAIVDSAITVHSALGPGLLETAYEACLTRELIDRGFKVDRQVPVSIEFKGEKLDVGFRMDLLVNDLVIVELKAVEAFNPIHKAQVMTYLKLSGKKLGMLLNFNVISMKNGVKRIVL